MRILLIINTVFEGIIAFIMIFVPTILLRGTDLSVSLSRVLGCNALALGTLSLLMLRLTSFKQLKTGLIVLSVFHVTVAAAQFLNFLDGNIALTVVLVHFLFASAFLFTLYQQLIGDKNVNIK